MVIGLMLGMFLGGFEMTALHLNEGVLARSDERPSDQRKELVPPRFRVLQRAVYILATAASSGVRSVRRALECV